MAELPDLIGKYQITQLIAQGGMGAVYKAVHPTLKRNVILKKLTVRGKPQFIERFKREARIMMDFKHDNIVTVYDHFKEGNNYYIVLEFVDGFSLEELIRRERALASDLAMHIFLEVCKALKYAHDNGVIHRDIKPANILISKKGEVKLVDFGIAGYQAEAENDEGLTTQGMTLGTVSYMPPEQFENTKTVDKVADIYAMGVMLYEMVTGKKPFPGNFSPDTLLMIKRGKYLHVQKLNPKIDRVIVRLARKMIRPKKEQRYQDLGPVIELLEKRLKRENRVELAKRLVAAMNGMVYIEPKHHRGHRVRRALGLGFVGLVLVAAAGGWLYYSGNGFEWFFPTAYGTLTITLPEANQQTKAELFVLASIQSDDPGDQKILDVPMPGWIVRTQGWLGLARVPGISSDKLHLAPGFYRLRLTSSQESWTESFYLQPYSLQKSEGRTQGMVLSYTYDSARPRPLVLEFRVLDSRMRQDITSAAKIQVKNSQGEWTAFQNFPKSALLSGRSYQLRISADGFHTKDFLVEASLRQTDIHVQTTLVPLEGTLRVTSSLGGLELLINGRDSVLTGGLKPALRFLRPEKDAVLFLLLPPGPLHLDARLDNRRTTADLAIQSNATIKLAVSLGSSKDDLVIKEIP